MGNWSQSEHREPRQSRKREPNGPRYCGKKENTRKCSGKKKKRNIFHPAWVRKDCKVFFYRVEYYIESECTTLFAWIQQRIVNSGCGVIFTNSEKEHKVK